MDLFDLITPEGIIAPLKAASKKQALQTLSQRAADLTGLDHRLVLDRLLERERLGTTGVGQGIAIPHGKFEELTSVVGLFARLDQPVDFESIDDQPVDLIFLLLAPEPAGAAHLKALARVSRQLRNQDICAKLRGSDSPDAIYALLTDAVAPFAA
jgi:PTS system nitrogen regulatory IIA component